MIKQTSEAETSNTTPTRLTLIAVGSKNADIARFVSRLTERFGVVAVTHKTVKAGFHVELDIDVLDDLVTAAEEGILDDELAGVGGKWVQSLIVRGEHIYTYLPPTKPLASPPILDVDADEIRQWKESVDLVLMTTTPVETEALYELFSPMPGTSGLLEGALEHATYRIGRFGRYCAAHVECTMSGEGRDGATLTVRDAVQELAPKAVVVIGIAFGVNRSKQRLGDVLIAETVEPYELAKIGKLVVQRGQPLPCGRILSERFRTRRLGWKFPRGLEHANVQAGVMLSGAKVIDSVEFRAALLAEYPTALGGEMEAAGAYAAAHRSSVEVIVVKAICDWADGLKNDRAQPFAARSAVSLAHYVLNKKGVLDSLGARDLRLGLERGTTRPASRPISQDEPAIVGRRAELDHLRAVCLPYASARVQPALTVFVQGIHGIGKTRLVLEFAKQVSAEKKRPVSYVDFQSEEFSDAPWARDLLPRGPRDRDLFRRLWRINDILGDLEPERLVIFDELEVLLDHIDESELLRFLRRACSYRKGPTAIFVVRKNWPAREGKIEGSPRLYLPPYVIVKPLTPEEGVALTLKLIGDTKPPAAAMLLAHNLDALSGGIPYLIKRWVEELRDSFDSIDPAESRELYQRLVMMAGTYFWASWDGMEKKEKLDLARRAIDGLAAIRDQGQFDSVPGEVRSRTGSHRLRFSPAFSWFIATEIGSPHHLATKPEPKQLRILLAEAYELATAIGDVGQLIERAVVNDE